MAQIAVTVTDRDRTAVVTRRSIGLEAGKLLIACRIGHRDTGSLQELGTDLRNDSTCTTTISRMTIGSMAVGRMTVSLSDHSLSGRLLHDR